MTTPDDTFHEFLLREVRLLLLPLAVATDSGAPGELLAEIAGWSVPTGPTDDRLVQFADAYAALDALIEHPPRTLADVLDGLRALDRLWEIVRGLPAQPGPGGDGPDVLGRNLAEALVLAYLRTWHPLVHDVLALLTIVRPPGEIALDRVTGLLPDPLPVLRGEYLGPHGLGSADDARAVADRLFPRLAALLQDLGLQATYGNTPVAGPLPPGIAGHLAGGLLSVYLQPDFEEPDRYGVTLALSPRDLGGLGLVVLPFGQVTPFWDVDIDLRAAADGFAVGSSGVTLLGTSGPVHTTVTPGWSSVPSRGPASRSAPCDCRPYWTAPARIPSTGSAWTWARPRWSSRPATATASWRRSCPPTGCGPPSTSASAGPTARACIFGEAPDSRRHCRAPRSAVRSRSRR
jgi:hypothetical protein